MILTKDNLSRHAGSFIRGVGAATSSSSSSVAVVSAATSSLPPLPQPFLPHLPQLLGVALGSHLPSGERERDGERTIVVCLFTKLLDLSNRQTLIGTTHENVVKDKG